MSDHIKSKVKMCSHNVG